MDWDEMARPWLDAASELEITHRPVLEALLAAAELSEGEHVLDVGSGTGPSLVAAVQSVGPNGRVTGVDVAPPLLARAAEQLPADVELVVADAGTHQFPDANIDIVLSNFGIMFFEDSASAFANLRRSVRPEGRLAATVWGPPSQNPWFSMPRKLLDEIVPDLPKPDPAGPGPMRFGDPTRLMTDLETAGWKPSLTTVDLHLVPPGSARQVAALHMKVTAGMMLRGVDIGNADLIQIEERLTAACQEFAQKGQIRFPAQIHVVTASANR
ncbi:MAG: class I SAM-dependent methyltransferase [Alphaproteobacteria bacterium]|nr:class I SAM-dependent methyltransferase [Alphaproteobacteria bacterium]